MQIITKAIFFDEDKKEEIESDYIFDLLDICNANSTDDNYTVITDRSTGIRTTIKIKFKTYEELIKKTYHKYEKIVE